MATTQEINDLVAAGTALKVTFEGKRDEIDDAVDNLNTAKANIVADETATAASRVNVEADETAVATSKSNVDTAETAVLAAAASVPDAIADALSSINLLRDGGRFGGMLTDTLARSLNYGFSVPTNQIIETNGTAAPVSAGKFESNNTNFGGSGPTLSQTVEDLITATGRSAGGAINGVEFYVAEYTMGSGTVDPKLTDHHLMLSTNLQAMAAPNGYLSMAYWVRCVSGSVAIARRNGLYVDGVEKGSDTLVSVADGWTHVCSQITHIYGYQPSGLPHIHAQAGSVVQLALPVYLLGKSKIPMHTAPVPTISMF